MAVRDGMYEGTAPKSHVDAAVCGKPFQRKELLNAILDALGIVPQSDSTVSFEVETEATVSYRFQSF